VLIVTPEEERQRLARIMHAAEEAGRALANVEAAQMTGPIDVEALTPEVDAKAESFGRLAASADPALAPYQNSAQLAFAAAYLHQLQAVTGSGLASEGKLG